MRVLSALYRKARKTFRIGLSGVWRRGLLHGVAATVEHDGLPLRRDFKTVIDVGANRGQFALYAKARFPMARLICFEPLSTPRRKLERLLSGDASVEIVPAAVGATKGSSRINIATSDDSSSLLDITSLQTSTFPNTGKCGEVEVPVITLDAFFTGRIQERPALLKLDVQGYELRALQGAERVLRDVDSVLVECSFVQFYEGQALFPDIFGHLTTRGFHLRAGHITSKDRGVWLQGDFLFERQCGDEHDAS